MPAHFQNIALSLSGGGYRAAAFHLGCMTCLHDRQHEGESLLKKLCVLSSISGGTITGVVYAHTLAEGGSFQDFYDKMYDFLKKDTLLTSAMSKLNNPDAWKARPLKQRNLINAFALVYDEELFHGATLGSLLEARGRMPEFAFNATDVEHSKIFRFAVSQFAVIGHNQAKITREAADEILLADIVAASSCFPGGFEPLLMPGDFAAAPDSPLFRLWEKRRPLRLMDGGITDNQGIESVKLFERRKSNEGENPYIGLFIISDASRKETAVAEETAGSTSFFLRWSLRQYQWLAALLAVSSVVLLAVADEKWLVVPASMILALCLLWLGAGYFIARKFVSAIKEIVSEESPAFMSDFEILQTVPLKDVLRELGARISSLGRLGDVFLNRIRDMNYKSLFGDSYWRERIMTNYIYHLLDKPSDARQAVELANQMGTTLWFSAEQKRPDAHMLDALIEAGRATMEHQLREKMEEDTQEPDL